MNITTVIAECREALVNLTSETPDREFEVGTNIATGTSSLFYADLYLGPIRATEGEDIATILNHLPTLLRWTAEPLAAPKPPLPTEVGAVIADVRGLMRSTCHVMTLDGDGEWLGVDADGLFTAWMPDEITDWKPARVVTDEADR